ncbi:unnamed protein product [Ilex paraguariensis]|uniref:Myb-like protein X n=1 Tax=Ilex paraguariensis TaxID=185542 RepID=A0ABC8UM30_9AQUA
MSRCFSFPPPGYEKKARPDDANLLTKEKHKENKHKKDKKDKEKKEGKEKKDKERSEEKHREKKDRKDKHKHKKDKDRDKEKKKTSDEKKIVGQSNCHNGNKLDPNHKQKDGDTDSKFLLDLGNRIRNDDGAMESRTVQKTTPIQRSAELPRKMVESNIGKLDEGNDKFKEKREDNRKIGVPGNKFQARGIENGFVQSVNEGEQRKVEGVARLVGKNLEMQMEGKEKSKPKNIDSRGDRNKDKDREKKSKSKDKKRKKEKKKEEDPNKEQLKLRESGNNDVGVHSVKPSFLSKESNKSTVSNGNLGKRKELEMNGFLHDNDTRPNKLAKHVTSSHQIVEHGRKLEPCQTVFPFQSDKKGTVTANNQKVNDKVSAYQPLLENERKLGRSQTAVQFASKGQGTVDNHKVNDKVSSHQPLVESERKSQLSKTAIQFPSKGLGTVNDQRVFNKVSSFQAVVENGGKLEPGQAALQASSDKQGGVSNSKGAKRESRINGLTEAQQPTVSSARPTSAPLKVKQRAEASLKPPHPDSKYLSQIIHVPKIEWSDFDDQEWLFNSKNLQSKKPKLGSSVVEGTKQVWAEALPIESADVTALPYVIPY